MKTFWVIQADRNAKRDLEVMTERMREMMIPFVGCQIAPFATEIEYLFAPPPEGTFVIPYGTTKLIALGQELGWQGIFHDPETFRVDAWVKHRSDMLNQDAELLTVREVEQRFTGWPDEDEHFFIRPVEDFKAFTGMVVPARELAYWSTSHRTGVAFGSHTVVRSAKYTLDTVCAVSPAQTIDAEYRYFVVDGRVVTGSMYHLGNKLVMKRVGADVISLVQQMVDRHWMPHRTCVMDIAIGREFGTKVIEFNTFNASGFYDHDIPAIVDEVTIYGLKVAMGYV